MNEGPDRAFVEQAKQHLLEDFLPKVRRCLELLTEEEIWWRAHENTNSVGNLTLHLCGNVRQWVIAGLGGHVDTRDRPREFSETGPISAQRLIEELEATLQEATRVLDELDAEKLFKKHRIQAYHVTGLHALFHVVEHFSYHTGQIIYITRLKKNIDLKFYDL